MKRTFSWPLFMGAAALLTSATWFLVESRETRIAGTITSLVIAWGFVRFAVIDDEKSEATPATEYVADTLVRNDIWSREPGSTVTPGDFEAHLRLPLLAVVRRRS